MISDGEINPLKNQAASELFPLEILKETKMQRSVGSVSCTTYVAAAAAAKLLQLCLTLCDPTDGSLF